MRVDVVVGGQFGSEAKGHVAAVIGGDSGPLLAIRVNGPNAGHTVIGADGQAWAFRHIPVAAVINPDAQLYIAPGSEVDPAVLRTEIDQCEAAGIRVRHRLYVDAQATYLTHEHINAEREADLITRTGSTGKGIGAARSERIWRRAPLVGDHWGFFGSLGCQVVHGVPTLPRRVLIEGTQGYGLGLHAGFYPHCTSADCRSIDFVAASGLNLAETDSVHTWVVFRTYPIRVAGNSGPLFGELTWDELTERSGGYIRPERTTVTQKIRRVGSWDGTLARAAISANGREFAKPVLSFVDYLDPALAGCTEFDKLAASPAWDWIQEVEADLGTHFVLFTTGPESHIWRS